MNLNLERGEMVDQMRKTNKGP